MSFAKLFESRVVVCRGGGGWPGAKSDFGFEFGGVENLLFAGVATDESDTQRSFCSQS